MGPKTIQSMSKISRLSAQSYKKFFRLDKWNNSKARRKHNASFRSCSFHSLFSATLPTSHVLGLSWSQTGLCWNMSLLLSLLIPLSELLLNRYYEKLNICFLGSSYLKTEFSLTPMGISSRYYIKVWIFYYSCKPEVPLYLYTRLFPKTSQEQCSWTAVTIIYFSSCLYLITSREPLKYTIAKNPIEM